MNLTKLRIEGDGTVSNTRVFDGDGNEITNSISGIRIDMDIRSRPKVELTVTAELELDLDFGKDAEIRQV